MRKKPTAVLVAVVSAVSLFATAPPASAKTIDCTKAASALGLTSSNGNPCLNLRTASSGRAKGKFIIQGTNGNDTLRGTRSKKGDLIEGRNGDDRITGERGNDILIGGNGNDTLDGSGDSDLLQGGNGNDTLVADSGRDELEGGPGNDRYIIAKKSHVIRDTSGRDTLELRQFNQKQQRQVRKDNNLVITQTVSPWASVTIVNWFNGGKIENVKFQGKFVEQRQSRGSNNGGGSDRGRTSGSGGGSGSVRGVVEQNDSNGRQRTTTDDDDFSERADEIANPNR